jgi:hypothetical protein
MKVAHRSDCVDGDLKIAFGRIFEANRHRSQLFEYYLIGGRVSRASDSDNEPSGEIKRYWGALHKVKVEL